MNRLIRTLAVSLVLLSMAAFLAAGLSCAEGDNQKPGKIKDLHFFFFADALIWAGRVSEGSTLGIPNTRILAWRAPGDDGSDGTAALYDVRYATSEDVARRGVADGGVILRDLWGKAHQLYNEPYPSDAGDLEEIMIPRLDPGDTLWFAVKTKDEVGQTSGLSNIIGPFRIRRLEIPVRPAAGDTALDFGQSLTATGDMNGDARLDFASSSPLTGEVAITAGKTNTGLLKFTANAQGIKVRRTIEELVPLSVIKGDTADGFGKAIAGIGRFNADTLNDLAIGAPGYDNGSTIDSGAIFVKYGMKTPPAVLSADSVDLIITGESSGDTFGASVAPLFDINGDARYEFVVGAPGAFGTGAAYIFKSAGLTSGSASQAIAVILGEAPGDRFGEVVASAGDVNGDGVSDIAIGAPSLDDGTTGAAGAVYIFYGGNAGVGQFASIGSGQTVIDLSANKADITIRGSAAGRRFGKSIASAGDLAGNKDFAYDLAVAGGDTVYVYFGGMIGPVLFPLQGDSAEYLDVNATHKLWQNPGEDYGSAVVGAGDVDRDGVSDLMVGAPLADKCYLYKGPISTGKAPAEILEPVTGGIDFCRSLSSTGDVNQDGYPDFLIGAPLSGQALFSF